MQVLDIERRLDKYLKNSKEFKFDGFEWRMSASGNCPRLMDLEIQEGKEQLDSKSIHRMAKGTALHTMWQQWWEQACPNDFMAVEKELKVTLITGKKEIVGHMDGYFQSLDATYELKTCGESTYTMVENQGHPIDSHREQGNFYAGKYGAKNVLFHYYNSNNGESIYFLVPYDEALWQRTFDKFERRAINEKKGIITERPYSDPTGSPCWFCNKKDRCYEGFPQQVESMISADVEVPEVIENVRHIYLNRDARLLADKTETRAKTKLSHWMLSRNLNKIKCDGHYVTVKLGKNNNPLVTLKEVKS